MNFGVWIKGDMAMKSRRHYLGGSTNHYPAISQAYWAPQPQTVPYSVPGKK